MPDLAVLIDHFIDWLEPMFATYGYLLVPLAALTEHTFFLAWAIPGGVLVSLGGLYAQTGVLKLPIVIVLATLGFMLGDHLDYFVGRRSENLVKKATKGRTIPIARLLDWRAFPVMLLAYTNTIPRSAMFMGGAASGLPYHRFLPLSFGMAVFWSAANSLIGYWIGSNRDELVNALKAVGIGGQVALLSILGIALAVYFIRRSRARHSEAALADSSQTEVYSEDPQDTHSVV